MWQTLEVSGKYEEQKKNLSTLNCNATQFYELVNYSNKFRIQLHIFVEWKLVAIPTQINKLMNKQVQIS